GAELAHRPEPKNGHRSIHGNVAVLDGLPGSGKDVRQVQESLVGELIGNRYRNELCLWHPQVLGLPARHSTVEARVSEEGGPLVFGADLSGLALCEQSPLAHEAGTA